MHAGPAKNYQLLLAAHHTHCIAQNQQLGMKAMSRQLLSCRPPAGTSTGGALLSSVSLLSTANLQLP